MNDETPAHRYLCADPVAWKEEVLLAVDHSFVGMRSMSIR